MCVTLCEGGWAGGCAQDLQGEALDTWAGPRVVDMALDHTGEQLLVAGLDRQLVTYKLGSATPVRYEGGPWPWAHWLGRCTKKVAWSRTASQES
jgi:hypothetical protein